MLPRTLDKPSQFSFWLRSLHVLLILPKFHFLFRIHHLLPSNRPQIVFTSHPQQQTTIESFYLYACLSALLAIAHNCTALIGGNTSAMVWPETDCQKSIEVDLLCCAVLTLYAIYQHTHSSSRVMLAAFVMPYVSPGAVLAGHLAMRHFPATHRELVTYLQQRVAASLTGHRPMPKRPGKKATGGAKMANGHGSHNGKSNGQMNGSGPEEEKNPRERWTNLGLWEEEEEDGSYEEACERLADALGLNVLRAGDGVLACGCGSGAELYYFKRRYGLAHITGIDASDTHASAFEPSHNVRLLTMRVEDIALRFPPLCFDKVIALDNVYHYSDKARFFADALTLLPKGGMVGVTDLLLKDGRKLPMWLRCVLKCGNVSADSRNLWTKQQYIDHLIRLGYGNVQIKSLGVSVLGKWLTPGALKYLDYGVVTATCEEGRPKRLRKKVAVVGSGLSGLAVAQVLKHEYDVCIHEARAKSGLSGAGVNLYGTMVDIPLRMIGSGYY
eukprot:g35382.t1